MKFQNLAHAFVGLSIIASHPSGWSQSSCTPQSPTVEVFYGPLDESGWHSSGSGVKTQTSTIIVKNGLGQVVATIAGSKSMVVSDSGSPCPGNPNLAEQHYSVSLRASNFATIGPGGKLAAASSSSDSSYSRFCDSPLISTNSESPTHYSYIQVPSFDENAVKQCLGDDPKNNDPDPCGSTNYPISYVNGNKWLVETDLKGSELQFTRQYNSNLKSADTFMGANWTSNFDMRLFIAPVAIGSDGNPYSKRISALRSSGSILNFVYENGAYRSDADRSETIRIQRDAGGAITGYMLFNEDRSYEIYSSSGRINSISNVNGVITTFAYLGDVIANVGSSNGEKLSFTYAVDPITQLTTYVDATEAIVAAAVSEDGFIYPLISDFPVETATYSYLVTPISVEYAANEPQIPENQLPVVSRAKNRIASVTDSIGNVVRYAYDQDRNLAIVIYADGNKKLYKYQGPFPHLLTEVVDEKGVIYASYQYDTEGRATTELIVPAQGQISIGLTYAPGVTTVLDELGAQRTYSFQNIFGKKRITGQSQPAGSGCTAASSAVNYNADGDVTSKTDFNGITTSYEYGSVRKLPTKTKYASGTSDAKEVNVNWHNYWSQPVQVDEPLKVTTYRYNGDNGNYCAPMTMVAGADGNSYPIMVTCSQVIRAKKNGVVDATVPARATAFTYDAVGRLLTKTDANNHITTYAYYTDNSFSGVVPNEVGHRRGDLQSITDPKGRITSFDLYTKNGDLVQTTDPKGIVTSFTYTSRGWMSSITTSVPSQPARVTGFSYDALGQQIGVSLPDGTTLTRIYDDAHRLIGVTDGMGNKVTYTLDAVGNRINESFIDPSGALQRTIDRSIDALNRVQQVTGAVR